MRNLTRYYVQLRDQKTALSNLCHSKEASHDVQAFIVKSNKTLIKQIDKQMKDCVGQITALIADDPVLNERIDKVMTIKGVGLITAATVVAETLGFEHFRSIKQLVSYTGYDVVQRESGTSIKGKTRISKKGNSYIRAALFFPAINCARFCADMNVFYTRVNTNKPSKMIGLVAVQRKLLALMFTLWKTDSNYIEGYQHKVASVKRQEATQDSYNELPSVY
jgi:transposase